MNYKEFLDKKCTKDLIEEESKEENKELFLKMDEILKNMNDDEYFYVRFKIPINEFLNMFEEDFNEDLELEKEVEFGFITLSRGVVLKTGEIKGYIWEYSVQGSFKGSYQEVAEEDGISNSCVKLKLLNLLKDYEYEFGYWE